MYPVIFLQIFPFLIIPTPARLPEPEYPFPFPHQPKYLRQAPTFTSRYNNYGTGYPIQRRENVGFPTQNPHTLQVSLTYPVTSSTSARTIKENDKCFTNDGRFGVCRQKFRCNYYTEYTSMYAERITTCGQRSQPALICCPEGQEQYLQNVNTKPTISTVKKPESTSTEQTLPFTSYNPNGNNANGSGRNKSMTNVAPTPTLTSRPGITAPPARPPPRPPTESFSVHKNNSNQIPMIVNGFDFTSPDAQKVCGVYDSKSQLQNENFWPWIVSIGRKYSNNTIEWFCLGSLITTEYIITTAHCLQGSPTVAALGQLHMGNMATHEGRNVDLSPIAEYFQFDKYVYPAMYKNVGLVRLQNKTEVSAGILPVCFPFLAGVLDILNFAGTTAQTIGLRYPNPVKNEEGIQSRFGIGEYRIFNNSLCSMVVKSNPSATTARKLPRGVKSDIMCAVSKTSPPMCSIAGAPLVVFDTASDSHVVIGLSLGDSTCSEFQRKITLFTRINSYSSWFREHVDEFPAPPPCYV